MLNRVPCAPAWSTCQRACVPARFTYQRACVPKACQVLILTCQSAKNVPTCHKACQCFNLSCQCAKRRANFSTWRTNVPKSVPIFQTFLLRNAKGNFYTLLLYKKFYIILDIILIHIMCVCIVHINCIILYFLKLFCSLDGNGNIKTPGFYTLQVTRVFSNVPQLKQLNKIKNTCE